MKNKNQKVKRVDKYLFIEGIGTPSFLIDPKTGNIIESNDLSNDLLGKSREEIIGMHQMGFFPPAKAPEYIQIFNLENEQRDKYCQILKKNGTVIPVKIDSSYTFVEGQLLILVQMTDITERRTTEEYLKDSEERFRCLANASFEAICIHKNGIILDANLAYSELFEYQPGEIIGMNSLDFVAPESREVVIQRLSTGYELPYELLCIKKKGETFVAEARGRNTRYQGENVRVTVLRDITNQKHLRENTRMHLRQIIRAQEEERKRIARELHDDTIQSLATLMLDIEMAKRKNIKSPESLMVIETIYDKVRDILSDVRKFCEELRPDVIDHLGIIAALELLGNELNMRGINTIVAITGKQRRLSPETEITLFRICQEALRNVWKHSEATKASIYVDFGDEGIKIDIEDNGCGFDLPQPISDLALQKKLGILGMIERARSIGGDIFITSNDGEGTIITLFYKDI